MKLRQPSFGTKAVIFLPFLMSCTRTHFRIAEFGCLASTPLRKKEGMKASKYFAFVAECSLQSLGQLKGHIHIHLMSNFRFHVFLALNCQKTTQNKFLTSALLRILRGIIVLTSKTSNKFDFDFEPYKQKPHLCIGLE